MPKQPPRSLTRVLENTTQQIDERMQREIEARVLYFAQYPDKIERRLEELAQEWDIERVLEAKIAGASLLAVLMARSHRKWLVVPFGLAAFLLLHAVDGCCTSSPIFRKFGLRTADEINHERQALRALRGDFDNIDLSAIEAPQDKAQKAIDLIRAGMA